MRLAYIAYSNEKLHGDIDLRMIFLFKITEPEHIRAIIDYRVALDGYIEAYTVYVADGVARMKANKNYGCAGLLTKSFQVCVLSYLHIWHTCAWQYT